MPTVRSCRTAWQGGVHPKTLSIMVVTFTIIDMMTIIIFIIIIAATIVGGADDDCFRIGSLAR